MSESVVRLAFPAKAEYLLLARLALSGVARGAPIDDELLADLKLAVTEACGNAVRHAYDGGDGEVAVRYRLTEDAVEMIVEDQGAGLHARPSQVRADAGLRDGGMGMAIIAAVVDEVEVRAGADGRGTAVRMVKRFASAGA